MSVKIPEADRIFMKDFPLMPGDLVIATMECDHCDEELPCIGEVKSVFSRNPDPGVTVELKTREEFLEHIGGEHNPIKLSNDDSMWANILFAVPCCMDFRVVDSYTYELVNELKSNHLSKIGPELFFANFRNFILLTRKHYQHKPA